jgi:wobble nucleotide-excising tRNase
MTTKERLDKHDKEIAAIRKLLLQGARMLLKNQEQIAEHNREMKDIRKAHRRLEETVERFIDGSIRAKNGHAK